ncbi:MAG: recombinase family protein [Planctomycetes bacterium]|nr:recombinase family protein [Planctomycetota bacterium]
MAKSNSNKRRAKAKATKPPAAIYFRMSTDDQVSSIDNQDRAVRKLAKAEYEVVATYSDPGKSASKRKVTRPDFDLMLAHAAAEKFDVILMYDFSRFTRLDILDSGPALNGLRDAGVEVHTVAEGRLNMADEFDRMKLVFAIERANAEARKIAIRSLEGRANKVKRGGPAGCKTPYGLAREVTDEKGKKKVYARLDKGTDRGKAWRFVPGNPEEVKVVRWLYREFAKRVVSYRQLADELNVKGTPSPAGDKWGGKAVKDILTSEKYVGDDGMGKVSNGEHYRLSDGECVESDRDAKGTDNHEPAIVASNIHKAIIKREAWRKVQAKVKRRRTTKSRPRGRNPLSRILVCGNCGRGLTVHHPKGGRVRYICPSYCKYSHAGCGAWSVAGDEVLPLLLDVIREHLDEALIEAASPKATKPAPLNNGREKRIEKQLAELQSKIKTGQERFLTAPKKLTAGLADTLEKWQTELADPQREFLQAQGEANQPVAETLDYWDSLSGRVQTLTQWREPGSKMRVVGVSDGKCKVGDESKGIVVSDPAAINQLLMELDCKVTFWWKPRPNGQRRWELDRGRITAALGGKPIEFGGQSVHLDSVGNGTSPAPDRIMGT